MDIGLGASSRRPRMGDRVRVRWDLASRCEDALHDLSERGPTGIVVGIRSLLGSPPHAYVLAFEPPLPMRHYAADELEQVDD